MTRSCLTSNSIVEYIKGKGVNGYSSRQQAAGFNVLAYGKKMLTDFSGYDPIQIIYKPQLVYYLHTSFQFLMLNL